MTIPPINPIAITDPAAPALSLQEITERATLIKAVNAINESNLLGDENELTFVLDRNTHRTLMRVIDRKTHELVMQVPPEYILRLADQAQKPGY